ncbi:DUF6894 family protein [Bradyrhizobium japonicum]|jgi:hypothetical protein|uniref:DUF6894 family protein n=1 Tax=Bradyrhizobium TaxID=374 RepID=UPI000231C48A|nr:hypothetical protein BJ6T_20400 [Bradyrhizobium japonicum USDA 6]GEC46001.1 hypothetical protein BJA01nite_36430 [Bradyrhizobium japonicum]
MLIYCFSVRNADGSYREATGQITLTDDNAARAFGKAMMRDMMRGGAPRYAGWTLDVVEGARSACRLHFPSEPIRSAALK